ncbi:MAG: Nif3-like dinuclear metal center hexameric protein [Verrucomicrobia bacterium]|nr:Nif3-like dinuclear metal center hexameric protein [Verrucomicrobiota bacterium]
MKGVAMVVTVKKVVGFLDGALDSSGFKDNSNNGLQVENSGRVGVVCCGVDASLEFFKAAKELGAGLLICHHGLSWGDSLKRITGLNYKRLSYLLRNDMALYACHLPLDAHPKYGNNARIGSILGLKNMKPFGAYGGKPVGFIGRFPSAMGYPGFKELVRRKIAARITTTDFGGNTVRSVAVVSGGGTVDMDEAARIGVDVFLTGEPTLSAYHRAQDYGMNVVYAGHYATETFGVKALGNLLRKKFRLQTEFVDLKTPF